MKTTRKISILGLPAALMIMAAIGLITVGVLIVARSILVSLVKGSRR